MAELLRHLLATFSNFALQMDDRGSLFADHFFGGVSQHPRRAGIEDINQTIHVGGNDRHLSGRVQHGLQSGLGLVQLDLGPLLLGHVREDSLHPNGIAARIVNRRLHHVRESPLAILRLKLFRGFKVLPRLHHTPIVNPILFGQVAWEEVVVGTADDLFGRTAEGITEESVGKCDVPL